MSNLVKVTIFIADCEYVRRSQSRGCVGRVVGDHWPSALTVVVDGLALLYRTIANCPAAVGAGLGSRGTGVQWIVDSRRALALASLL